MAIDKQNRLLLFAIIALLLFELYTRSLIVSNIAASVAAVDARVQTEAEISAKRAELANTLNIRLAALEKKIDEVLR